MALGIGGLLALLPTACAVGGNHDAPAQPETDPAHAARREAMVVQQIEARGVRDPRVLRAMREVPRHLFVAAGYEAEAYRDSPLPIGHDQTISQPYIVALMTELIRPRSGMKVLEIGTGSGYQAAVLAEIVDTVYSIEIVPALGREAAERLRTLGYGNAITRVGDGFDGWPDEAPFDAIVVTAAPERIPRPLLDQLAEGGRLVIPVGDRYQHLVRVTRTAEGFDREQVTPVRFVPMTGKAEGAEGR